MNLKKAFAEIVIVSLIFSTTIFTGCVKRVPEDPNTLSRTFLFDGLERTYRIHIPADLSENPSPALVFVLHGGLGTGEITELDLMSKFEVAEQIFDRLVTMLAGE